MADVIKYVSIEGRVQIEYQKGIPKLPDYDGPGEPDEDVLVMKFLNPDFTERTDVTPLFFYLKDEKGNPNPVKFRHVHLTAAFNTEGFERVEKTLRIIDPLMEEWGEIETVLKAADDMNPSGPPKPKMGP